MPRNEYLKRREERMRMERDGRGRGRRGRYDRERYDGRNPYGSEGGYVTTSKGRRDKESGSDYYSRYNPFGDRGYDDREYNRYDSEYFDGNHSMDDERYREFDMDQEEDIEQKYKRDLKHWVEDLKQNDRFKIPKEKIIERAKSMSIDFDDFTEEELYTTYLMLSTMFKTVANDYNIYLKMAKDFLMAEDDNLYGSNKICAYFYEIHRGGK